MVPKPGVYAAIPTTRIQIVLTRSRGADPGSGQWRGMFQDWDKGSAREAARHDRSSLTYTSPAMLTPPRLNPRGRRAWGWVSGAQPRTHSMRYHTDPSNPGHRCTQMSGSFTGSHPLAGRSMPDASARAAAM